MSTDTTTSTELQRDLKTVTAEIRVLRDQANQIALGYAIEIGRRLEEAKALLEHGEWLPWLKENGFSTSSASNLMRISREYGAEQFSILGGEAKCQTLGNLSYTKALLLLAVPEAERENVAEELDAERISVRELKEKLAERERELDRQSVLRQQAEEQQRKLNEQLKAANAAQEEAEELREKLKELENRPVTVAVETKDATEEQLTAAREEAAETARQQERERLKKKLKDAEEKMKQAEQEAQQAKVQQEQAEQEAQKAKAQQEQAERDAKKMESEAERLKKEISTSADQTMMEFKLVFAAVQKDINDLLTRVKTVQEKDRETGEKMRRAVQALLTALGQEVAE